MQLLASEWNSLEVAKLALALLTPLVIFWLGLRVSESARRVENAQWANRTFIERRLELYKEMAPLINDLYCVFLCVGRFRDITPRDAVAAKRQSDRAYYTNEYLFSPAFRAAYQAFMDTAFRLYTGSGHDAQLRMRKEDLQRERGDVPWDSDWDRLFAAPEQVNPPMDVKQRYRALMEAFAAEIGVEEKREPSPRRIGVVGRRRVPAP